MSALRSVRGVFAVSGEGVRAGGAQLHREGDGRRFADLRFGPGGFEVSLPEGAYAWRARGREFADAVGRFEVQQDDVDLGRVDVEPAARSRLLGAPAPPWKVTAARGIAVEEARPERFRGRWLVLEFWGFT
ncbi:MAG: hypothetical protein R3F20_08990 [Planctomycetota bacterium]